MDWFILTANGTVDSYLYVSRIVGSSPTTPFSLGEIMEPYNKKEPFISMKLDGSLLDRLVEAGIPLTRALQYFRDNPEGPASETAKLVAEEIVPFYYNYRNNGDLSDYAKEAALIALPMKGAKGRPTVDPVRTAEFNKLYGEVIDNMAASKGYEQWAADMKNKYGQEKPWTLSDYTNNYDYYNNYDYIKDSPELAPYRKDIILDNTMGTTEPIDVKDYLKPYHRESGFGLGEDEMFPSGSGSALERAYKNAETDSWAKAVAKHNDIGFNGAVVDYFQPSKYDVNDASLTNKPYSITLGDLAEAKQLAKERAINSDMEKFVYGDRSYYGEYDSQLRNIRDENYRKDYADLHDEYYNTLTDNNIDRKQKAAKLNVIINKLNLLRSLIDIE